MRVVDRHLGNNRSVADSGGGGDKQIFISRLPGALSRELEIRCTAVGAEVHNIIRPL